MRQTSRPARDERGIALLVTVLILAMTSALVVAALSDSGGEAASSGRIRAAARALYVADAGIELARNRIGQSPPNLAAFDVGLDGGWRVQSGTKSDAAPQPLATAGKAGASEGYSLNVGSGFASDVYLVNVTSTLLGGGTAEVEAKLAKPTAGIGGY